MGKTPWTLDEGERVLFEQHCTGKIPRKRRHQQVPGRLTVTNRRIVHDYAGLFGLGASRHVIPLEQVTMVTPSSESFGWLEVSTVGGHMALFQLGPSKAEEVAERIRTAQAEP
ncbi:hypothetical protein [Bounagaea algeriensis]